MERIATLAILGDSAAYGIGDMDSQGNSRGWSYYLAKSFEDPLVYVNFSRPGAQSAEVLNTQLPKALHYKPDIAAVIVGGNDLLRNGFCPDVLYENLVSTCTNLLGRGSEILMIQLHDPTQLLRLPILLKRVLRRRVEAVNEVYEKVSSELGLILIRTREIPDVHNLKNWHIDRMHPGPFGHQILARQMAIQLRNRGWNLALPLIQDQPLKSKSVRVIWLIKNGLPWFLKRSVDLLPAAILLMVLEFYRVCRAYFTSY